VGGGEEFLGEKDLGTHWLRPHDAVSHIPLIVKGPTQIAEYDGPIQPIDIHTTLLEELDLNYDLSQGFDLRHENREWCVIQSGERRTERIVNLVRDHYPNFDYEDTGLLTAIRTDEFKYEQSEASERLYSLPDESTDIASESPGVADEFRLKYEEFVQKLNSYPSIGQTKTNITPETKKRLEKMGYLVD
jgi:uncharacterized sulfatase